MARLNNFIYCMNAERVSNEGKGERRRAESGKIK